MIAAGAVGADGFVWDVAVAAFDAIIHADLTYGTEGFVVKRGNAECGAQFFIEFAQAFKVRSERGKFEAIVGEQKFLVAGIPEARELAFEHDGRKNGHLVFAAGFLAEFGATAIFFNAHDAARAAYGKTKCGETFNSFGQEAILDTPH